MPPPNFGEGMLPPPVYMPTILEGRKERTEHHLQISDDRWRLEWRWKIHMLSEKEEAVEADRYSHP